MHSKSVKQQGIAMVVVLWMIMIMMTIAGTLQYSVRTQMLMTGYNSSTAQYRAFADAAAHYTIMQLYLPQDERQFQVGNTFNQWDYDGYKAEVRIIGENGLVDLNRADRNLLQQIMNKAGIMDDQAESLLDAIEDFRDPDDLARVNGAEDSAYEEAGFEAGAKDAPFERIEELQQVMGVDADIYKRLSRYLTVVSGVNGINPMLASREVLLMLADGDEAAVDDYILQREESEGAWVQPTFGMQYLNQIQMPVYRLQIRVARDDSDQTYQEERSVRLLPGRTPPFMTHFRSTKSDFQEPEVISEELSSSE